MLKVNDVITVTIEKIVFGGEGLARYEDIVVFVPMSCIGDKLEVKVISVKKTYVRALIQKVIVPSEDRKEHNKISFEENSGCDFNHIKYEKQLEYKDIMLKDMLKSISKLDVSNIYKNIIGASNVTNYRNKVATPFFIQDGKIKVGFYKRKSHTKFSIEEDYLKSIVASKIEEIILKELNDNKFTVYNEDTDTGFLRCLIIRNNTKGEAMVCIVVNKNKELDKLKVVLKKVYDEVDFLKSVYVSIKNQKNNIILGEKNIHLFGDEYISENIFSIDFKIYVDSFFQINIEQVKKLYKLAISFLDNTSNVIDAFSGTGTIGMILAKNVNKVYCIESVKSAVLSGKKTAKKNDIKNIEFICNRVEKSIASILNKDKIDSIVFDPPRKGIEESVIKEVCSNNIRQIVYISCEPSRFARDLNIFRQLGYELKRIASVDMFPNTHHIESVALIEKKKED